MSGNLVFYAGLAAAILALTSLPLSTASASMTKSVTFAQDTALEFPGIPQSLRGVNSTVTCPDGTTVGGEFGPLFEFDATREQGESSGFWRITAAPGAADTDDGEVTFALITPVKFKLLATWDPHFGSTHAIICDSTDATIPADVVIKGECGEGVMVQFKSSNGVTGSFQGNVTCSV